jgi:hypothetical protein
MRRDTYSRKEVAFLIGTPLGWALLLLLHPTGPDDYYAVVRDHVTPWLVVHLGTMLFIPLLAAAMFVLLRGVDGTAARVSRIALVGFAIFYAAFEVVVGIGSGILANAINALPAGERAAGAGLLADYNESAIIIVLSGLGSIAWVVAVTAAGVALYQRTHAAMSIAVVALFVVSAPGILIHVTPFGPIGLALFTVALVMVIRGEPAPVSSPVPPLVGHPGTA